MTRMDHDNQWEEFTRRTEARISHAVELLILLEESIRYDPDPWRHYVRHHIGSVRRALVGTDSVLAPGRMPETGRIVEYLIMRTENDVNEYLQKGWELYGTPSYWKKRTGCRRFIRHPIQAMVRREGGATVAARTFPSIHKQSDTRWEVFFGPGTSDWSFATEADARAYIASKIRVEGK